MARNEGTNIICCLRVATAGILNINVNFFLFNVSYRHDLHERNYFNYSKTRNPIASLAIDTNVWV
jgi:hypothetical protein